MNSAKPAITPMIAQYLEIKADHPQALLFYRMGDFYEMFFEDAVAAAEALDIALTKRGRHLDQDIPMCGVPVHSAEGYLLALIRKGFRVAICEQLEDPAEARKRGAKSVVKRGVTRLVTPGTLTEENLLDARRNSFLAAYCEIRGEGALAWLDISTGHFRVSAFPPVRLGPELARVGPQEIIVADTHSSDLKDILRDSGAAVTPISDQNFDSGSGERRLVAIFQVQALEAFAAFTRVEISAMGAVINYLETTQKGKMPMLRPPVRESAERIVQVDAATRRNLELTHALSGGRDGSLLAAIDRTLTPGGGRLLERRLRSPSRNIDEITGRLDAVEHLVAEIKLAEILRTILRRVPDMDRATSRLTLDRGGPRDLTAIRAGLSQARDVARLASDDLPIQLGDAIRSTVGHESLIILLDGALVAQPPLLVRDGGFIADGFDTELDDARKLRDDGRSVIAQMQADYAAKTAIGSLKIKHNNVLGYFVETTAGHGQRMLSEPLCRLFRHRQTTANAVRFTTVELNEMETRILNAGARALEIERQIFASLRDQVLAVSADISDTALALAELDVTCAMADLARGENWSRPKVDESRTFKIIGGRHPIVEQALLRQGKSGFVANDCDLSGPDVQPACWLLTGPNMAGKSTFLRQNALIAILAQTGSFVSAAAAHIGLVSQVFSRVGAADDLARGRSTFMVEMVETAAILNQADDRALVILDEIGRGTATYDGLSIAWATFEHLHDQNRCRALFATHYHEMSQLAERLGGAMNATVAVKEWQGDVVFLHEVRKGSADRSYGVQVARLAGLPESVVARAKVVLAALEKSEQEGGRRQAALIDDLPLFSAVRAAPPVNSNSLLENRISQIQPDALSPKDALDLIYELKSLMTSGTN